MKKILIFLTLTFSTSSFANKWTNKALLSGSLFSGNTNLSLLEAGLSSKGEFKKHTFLLEAASQYKSENEESFRKYQLSINDVLLVHTISSLSDRWGAFIDFNYLRDDTTGTKNSFDLLIGGGHNFFGKYRGSKKNLKLSIALGYRTRQNSDSSRDDKPIISSRIKFRKELNNSNDFKTVIWHKADLDKSSDYEVKGEASLDNKISRVSTISFKYEYAYDNTPVEDKKKTDSIYKVQFAHQF